MIRIYTDGACIGNPGPGGWAAVVIIDDEEEKVMTGGEPYTTNNKMELSAVINVLKTISEDEEIEIYTDSTYVKEGITSWIYKWKQNNWLNAQKKPVKNKELWIQLDRLVENRNIHWHWVRGHSGNHYNGKADQLARAQCCVK